MARRCARSPIADGIWRYPTTPERVSPLYVQALLTYEDRWFWRHPGINPVALLRAAGQWARSGRVVSGGSTLTMQVARILDTQGRPLARTPIRKLRQMLRALQLEAHLSKREILTLYLDRAPFGGTVEGVEAASWAYLGKPASRLSHAEAALLAVLPQSPSRLRPDREPERARIARDKVLARMQRLGRVERRRRARRAHRAGGGALAAAAALAHRCWRNGCVRNIRAPRASRRRSTSNCNAFWKNASRHTSRNCRNAPRPRCWSSTTPPWRRGPTSVRWLSPMRSDWGTSTWCARGARPGSTLKPFLYGLALDDGLIHSESLLVDAPQSFGDYRPGNFDAAFNGPVGAAEALRLSLNVPAVDLLDRVGPARFSARLAHAGIRLQWPRGASPNLSMILGGTGARLEDLVGAYAALNREGVAGRVRYTCRCIAAGAPFAVAGRGMDRARGAGSQSAPGRRRRCVRRARPRRAWPGRPAPATAIAMPGRSAARADTPSACGLAGLTARRCPGSTAR